MKILQLVTSTDRRGAEVFALELERVLRSHGRTVATVALALGRDPEPIDVPVLGSRPRAPGTLRALRRAARGGRDLVVGHGSATLAAGALALVGSGLPFVYRNIGDPDFWAASAFRRVRSRALLRRTRAVVAVSDAAAGALVDRFGVPTARVRVIPTGVPVASFPPVTPARRADSRRRLGVDTAAPTAIVLGALSREKNVPAAIDALAWLPDVGLLVVGAGPERARLEAHALAVLPGRVQFLGSVRDPSTALAAADVLVLPSRTEGLPAAAIEAGLSGLPVAAADVGYVRDVVVDGETGAVATSAMPDALAAAIRRCLDAAPAWGRAATDRCRAHFNLEAVATAWERLLDGLSRSVN